LESAKDGKPSFQEKYLGFRVHTNAIIDMTFSGDDSLLATASGDQSARVVDMGTQTTIAVLGVHNASLKQVRFQPGCNNKNILATSGRDGSIYIWDLRCKGWDGPQSRIWTAIDGNLNGARATFSGQDVIYSRPSNGIMDAHRPIPGQPNLQTIGWTDAPNRGEATSRLDDPGRSTDISVTSLQFLHPGREHLLLSTSEANSSVNLWDIRALPSKRPTLPLAVTALPLSHYGYRNYGITSLNLNSSGSTFYTLCKDSVVYAYRTSHLILGQAPELDTPSTSRMPPVRPTQEGQGPVYGLRNKNFQANTFYVKSALRTTKNGHSELLAVGSTAECAVLFPTDERYLTSSAQPHGSVSVKQKEFETQVNGVPIYWVGTSLVRGHDREVGSLTWTHDGELATVGDDLTVRCWREDRDSARDLRNGGEGEGRRWGCGWADVQPDYDDYDEC
jgi:WD40 repeat protein